MEVIRALDVFNRCVRCRRCKRWKSVMVRDERCWKGVSDLCATCARKPVREGVASRRRRGV